MLKLATKLAPDFNCLDTAYRAGFRHAEIWLDGRILEDWRAVLQRTRHYPFGYALHFPNRPELSDEALHGCVELYRGLNCRTMVIHQPMFDRYAGELLQQEPSLCLAIENHNLTPAQLEAWAERSSALTLDVEHLWMFTYPGASLSELHERLGSLLQRWGAKVRHVHLPGYWPGCETHRPMYCGRDLVFGTLSLLAEHHFDGLIVSEANMEYQNRVELQMDALLFEAWRQRHEPLLQE
jgi:hypothetical protein